MTSPWAAKFVDKMDQPMLLNMLAAASHLGNPNLQALMGAKIASMLKGKTAQQMGQTFTFQNDDLQMK